MIWRVLKILLTLSLLAICCVFLAFLRIEHAHTRMAGVELQIEYNQSDTLLDKQDIEEIINTVNGDIRSSTFSELDIIEIEHAIRGNEYVDDCSLTTVLNGSLRVKVKQRTPIIRIIQGDYSCYLDKAGIILPLSNKYVARVPIATGKIYMDITLAPGTNGLTSTSGLSSGNKVLADIHSMAVYIYSHPGLKPLIEQIHINESSEFELISKFGSHIILFGTTEDLQSKFNNLLAFYQQGITQYGWTAFEQVNLKYKNQVVCIKNE